MHYASDVLQDAPDCWALAQIKKDISYLSIKEINRSITPMESARLKRLNALAVINKEKINNTYL